MKKTIVFKDGKARLKRPKEVKSVPISPLQAFPGLHPNYRTYHPTATADSILAWLSDPRIGGLLNPGLPERPHWLERAAQKIGLLRKP